MLNDYFMLFLPCTRRFSSTRPFSHCLGMMTYRTRTHSLQVAAFFNRHRDLVGLRNDVLLALRVVLELDPVAIVVVLAALAAGLDDGVVAVAAEVAHLDAAAHFARVAPALAAANGLRAHAGARAGVVGAALGRLVEDALDEAAQGREGSGNDADAALDFGPNDNIGDLV